MKGSGAAQVLAACAIVAAVMLWSQHLQKPTDVVLWDAGQYYSMARQYAAGQVPYAESPYVFRVGVPWLVSRTWPSDPPRGFFVVNLASAFAVAILLTIWLRSWGLGRWTATAMVALFAAAWHGAVRYPFFNPGYVDPPFLAVLLLGLLLIRILEQRWSSGLLVSLTALSMAGMFVRETTILVPLCFLFVNGPGSLLGRHDAPPVVPRWALPVPLALSVCVLVLTHAMVTVDLTERASMLGAAYQWLHKSPDAYLVAWFTAFGPVVAIVLFDWRRASRFLLEHAWLGVFLAGCGALAFIGGSDTERFASWSLPVVYLLLGRAIEHHRAILSGAPLLAGVVLSQLVASRIFWGIPDPRSDTTSLASTPTLSGKAYGVLDRLFVFDDFHWNLWSSFGSRPFRLLRLGWYLGLTILFVLLMRRRARGLASAR